MDESTDQDLSGWSNLSDITDRERQIQYTVKKMLVHKVFIGEYIERHYVDSLRSYRDIVILSPDENQLIETVKEACNIIQIHYGTTKWLGITSNSYDRTPRGHCLWVELSKIPLGRHWFQIQSVKFKNNEILLRLKYLRPFQPNESQTSTNALDQSQFPDNFDIQKFIEEIELSQVFRHGQQILLQNTYWCLVNFKEILTYQNLRETIRFTSILILAVLTFLVEAARYLGDYSLKITREMSHVIRALTPVLLGIVEFFTKCVGGFYLLILMLWRGSSGPPPPSNAITAAFSNNRGSASRKAIGYKTEFHNQYPYVDRVPQPRGRFAQL